MSVLMSVQSAAAVRRTMYEIANRHRVDLVVVDEHLLVRGELSDEWGFRLRSRPWFSEHRFHEQALRPAHSPAEIINVVDKAIGDGAAALRGAILRDLILNWNDYPLDVFDRNRNKRRDPAEVERENIEILERLARLLRKHAKGDLAERIGVELLSTVPSLR